MNTEFEATFTDIDKDEMREKLKQIGAKLVYPERAMKRYGYAVSDDRRAIIRVRDEGDKITLTYKHFSSDKSSIERQQEIEVTVSSFEDTNEILKLLGCKDGVYQETKRELWEHKGTHITLDTWPFLEHLIEIEGDNESIVKEVSEELGFDYGDVFFGPIGELYIEKYNIDPLDIPVIAFDMENPFV